ncbi:hypothetical protein O181_080803 [Austropuccinia psidii MF-1]|uniref:Uncharacterized protein n=1 Tax=Austropuccinia psidii MF-1 TaxID=1389203 RepID=A0A9Q3IGV2_9BASI|nr:hypothetical protein [Austropuccinia psidii MF-1]
MNARPQFYSSESAIYNFQSMDHSTPDSNQMPQSWAGRSRLDQSTSNSYQMPQSWAPRLGLDQFAPDSNQKTQSWAPRSRFITNHWSTGSNGDGSNFPVIQHPIPMVSHMSSNIVHSTAHFEFYSSSVHSTLHAHCANPLDTTYIGEAMSHELHPISPMMGHSGLSSHAFSPPSLTQSVKWMHLPTSTPTGHVWNDTSDNSRGSCSTPQETLQLQGKPQKTKRGQKSKNQHNSDSTPKFRHKDFENICTYLEDPQNYDKLFGKNKKTHIGKQMLTHSGAYEVFSGYLNSLNRSLEMTGQNCAQCFDTYKKNI